MHTRYSFLFDNRGMWFSHLILTVACACDCVHMCVNFKDEFFF